MNRDDRPVTQRRQSPGAGQSAVGPVQPANLADLLERVLEKGIVIAGDITLSLGTIELLTLKIRLLIASVDKAQQIGIDWWRSDPALSSEAKRQQLEDRIERLEARLGMESEDGAAEAAPREDSDLLEQRLARLETRLGAQAPEDQQSGNRS
ncbi:MAG: gas vesicle protein [Chloroflexi bacterium]|nr:gas vesicle protein [Chloroflexota bacterium]